MKRVPLGELIRKSRSPRAGTNEYPLLSMTMRDGLVDQSRKFKKRVASQDLSTYKVVHRGQLVVGFPIDEAVLDFQTLYPEAIVSPAYGVWDLNDDRLADRAFVKRYLRSGVAIAYYKAKLRGSTARRRSLPDEDFLAQPIPLPPIEEQRRIAAILDQADAIRAKRRQILAHLDSLTQSIFHDMFGDASAWTTIGDLAVSTQYGSSAKAGSSGEWPMLRMGNVTYSGRLDLNDLKFLDLAPKDIPKYTVQRGDLLFNRTNSAELVGKTCVVTTDRPLAFAGYLVRARFARPTTALLVSGFLNSPRGKATLRGMAKAIVGQANINATELRSIRVPAVYADYEASYAKRVDQLEVQRAVIEQGLCLDDELFASLQSRAFRGEL